ncbi:aspartate-semialdehyde dehydrogenase [Pseudoalteromonas tunicata]|jgi:aspartate-semialdehyde dehydrogenase|uniref:Aspartate-semialdehyde dehydrogenase n=1 Tax=Pseudoalteromonas tunicata D2 TaxID=87626 RepID=A4CD01_9GAMM|nr:aspartate-semialdehyde dehydrogenase [Pseudoalteromonas tunicata]ATC93950.1 aspartate-semialdehyde dehydrogenase [Pseudoalteromonas tunicata]AXT29739.1 aspartate-semialdehyde dehydrogenase [Pseudoalteromonas tunicata]EAR27444.1 Aspartate-semialdehyde dehydrogenase (ASA dehydrogenase) (ASADH) [Pseudoalteromonas tunicata D2]MDP4983115.1 aspartate-semialdehyde dehydrogenase [Pseudoalteromonas tunicata]MDP5212945.1 aspartate-semialdehyde dehydrogenase [Pseudoalteromonas tunicata]
MSQKYNIAILGATGLVGRQIIETLSDRKFPVDTLYLLASSRSAGEDIRFDGQDIEVQDVANFDFSLAHIAIFSAGSEVSLQYAEKAAEAGCIVIDNTSAFRNDFDIPLVVPEVNLSSLEDYRNRNIIANPNCSTIQMLLAIKPVYDAYGIDRINICTYQAVSGAGKEAVDELAKQTANLMNARPMDNQVFPKQIAFNVIPQIDDFTDNGYTKEEMKIVNETQKILGDSTIAINPTAVRVPVFFGHAEAIHLETRMPYDLEHIKELLRDAPGVELIDAADDFPTPVSDASGNDTVYVGRLRQDISHPHGLNMWVVADNTRKGAATNSVQIAEALIESYL